MRDRATLDSNVLVYSEIEPLSDKGRRASRLIAAAAPRGILTVQALLEFVAVVRRKRPAILAPATQSFELWRRVFELAPTTPEVAQTALALSRDHGFQVWDAVIWSAAKLAGATVIFSEDLKDGLARDGMRVINPFVLSEDAFAEILAEGMSF